MHTLDDALAAIDKAWNMFVHESRCVLGSELHYQAMLYHHLRQYGQVPLSQIGMNVKIWIRDCVTPLFQQYAQRKALGYQVGFEPIPDIVLFKPEINGDWRRRNAQATFQNTLVAIEVKASERSKNRLNAREIQGDLRKLQAHRTEMQHQGGAMQPVMIIIDTAPDIHERMRPSDVQLVCDEAHADNIVLYYVSQDRDFVVH